MNVGRYIFAQVLDFLPRYEFEKLVAKYKGDFHAKDLSCYNQLLHLLFGQLTGCDSLRDICLCLEAHKSSLYHLGFRNTVTISSLSLANENRDYHIYEEFGKLMISIVRPMYADTRIEGVIEDNVMQIYRTRYQYILYEALSKMKVMDISVKWGEFEKPFTKFVGDKGGQYVIIDNDSFLIAQINLDKLPEGQKWSLHRYYKGAYYYDAGYSVMYNLRDVPLIESFDKTIVVVRWADLPLVTIEPVGSAPKVTISDEANMEMGGAFMRIIADLHLVAKYNRDAEVLRMSFKK